jgi:hypothetical protein
MLRQEGEIDCGVCVFGKLVGLTREEIIFDIPDAVKGITDKQWQAYFNVKGLEMVPASAGRGTPATVCPLAPDSSRRLPLDLSG